MTILLVENSPNVARSFNHLSNHTDIAIVKPYCYQKYPAPKDFDGILVTGGKDSMGDAQYFPYLKIESEFLLRAMNLKVPILGICLGCQIIVNALGGIVGVRKEFELGWIQISLTPEGLKNPLFENIPSSFHAFESHRDEITFLPLGAVCLAKSDLCKIQALQYKDRPIWGIQFHPENKRGKNQAMDAINEINEKILTNFLDFTRRR